jgi:putative hydrolase of the HAD superfamily
VKSDIQAILWDFGGVILSSPFEAFTRFEQARGLPDGFLRRVNSVNPDTNAWAQLERNELSPAGFDTLFESESRALGHAVPGREVLALLAGEVRPRMVAALQTCKQHFRVACITNNAPVGHGAGMAADAGRAAEIAHVLGIFEHVVESSKTGLRKPDPKIYLHACALLGVAPEACVFLDDLGINLKHAKALGMRTIKVGDPDKALDELAALTGLVFA